MSKILITGDNGYVGSMLKPFLKERGMKIFTFKKKINKSLVKDKSIPRVDTVVHLAAKTNIPDSWDYKNDFINQNINSTKYILDYCIKYNSILIFISSYLYGNTKIIPTSENVSLKSLNPYSLSKKICEDICKFYQKNYGLELIIIRPFNIYGPNQDRSRLIANIIYQVKNNKNEITLNSLSQKRDYVYIEDFCDLIYTLILNNVKKGIFNLGSGKSYSINSVVKIIQKITKDKKTIKTRNVNRRNDVIETKADVRKLFLLLGWKPKWSLEKGIAKVLKK